MKHKLVKDPVFRSEVLFYHCEDDKAVISHAKRKYGITITSDFSGNRGQCLEIYDTETQITTWLIWLKHRKDWKTMVHEAAHVTFRILEKRGVKTNSDNDETWCYLHEFFIAEFWHEMTKEAGKK